MRLRQVEISNFRGFNSFEIVPDGESLFLIGENASGKTSLLTGIARALGRDRTFTRADFGDLGTPIEITATLDEIDPAQRGVFGNHVDFATGRPASLRVQARAVWDPHAEQVETEHLYPKDGQRSQRSERDAIPLLWLSATRDVGRMLEFGVPRNLLGQLLDQLPLQQSLDDAIQTIQSAGEQFAADSALQDFLARARDGLSEMLPRVDADAYSMGLAAATDRDLLRQFEMAIAHLGGPVPISEQSSGLQQLSVFIFALMLATASPGMLLLIDEPEVSLHPQAQRALVQNLRKLESQTLISTHSSNLLERGDPRRVARLVRSGAEVELALPATLSDEEATKFARFTNPHTAEAFFARSVILVEGESDRRALEALAEKQARNLDAEGIAIVPINGAVNAVTYIDLFGPRGFKLQMSGLYDEAEQRFFARGVQRAGLWPSEPTPSDMESLGFHACVRDLEDEMVRALGTSAVQQVIAENDDTLSFDQFQAQPDWANVSLDEQILGFLKAGRKVPYAPLLIDATPETDVPSPLIRVLEDA